MENCKPHYRSSVYDHLTDKNRGFLRDYTQWIFHGEKSTTSSGTMEKQSEMGHDMGGLIRDVFAMPPSEEIFSGEGERNPEVGENVKFYKLVKENEQEKLNKYDNETGTSQSVEEIQSDMPWKDDIYSKVKGTEKRGEQRGRLRCIGKIPKPKKLKVYLAENQELRDKVKQMEKKTK
ncbi:hypothetical protein QL285_028398 [Trifolium repens]|nr:hypothetical protein QL285_028398 [Trifolium repens]